MNRKGNHSIYENSIEKQLINLNVNYIATNEKKRAPSKTGAPLKNFDIIINSELSSFFADFKGKHFPYAGAPTNLWENWVKKKDVEDLIRWDQIFRKRKCELNPLLIFIYQINNPNLENLFKDVYKFKGKKFGLVAIDPYTYKANWKPRSGVKDAYCVSRKLFKTLVRPLSDFIPEIGQLQEQ